MSNRRSAKVKNQKADLLNAGKSASPLDAGFIVIGKLRRPHGVRGDMLFEVMTEFPERIIQGKHIYVGEDFQQKTVVNARNHHVGLILHIEGYDTPEDVGVLRNLMVYVPIEDLPELDDGGFYQHELIGLEVVTEDGEVLGTLSEIMETKANDVLIIVDEEGNELLLPDIETVVLGIDPDNDQIVVQPPEYL